LIAQEIIQNLQAQQKFEEALSWIEKVKKSYPKSPFLENIKNQENQILQPTLMVHLSKIQFLINRFIW
jgi:hypothetical protein